MGIKYPPGAEGAEVKLSVSVLLLEDGFDGVGTALVNLGFLVAWKGICGNRFFFKPSLLLGGYSNCGHK